MRTFVRIKQFALEHKELTERLTELEHYFIEHCNDNKNDLKKLYEAMELLAERTKPSKIGFRAEK